MGSGTFVPAVAPTTPAGATVQLYVVPGKLEDREIFVALPEQIVSSGPVVTAGAGKTITFIVIGLPVHEPL